MSITGHAPTFGGKRVEVFTDQAALKAHRAWCIRLDHDAKDTWVEVFKRMLATPGAKDTAALVVGAWGEVAAGADSSAVVAALVGSAQRLPSLEALLVGDIATEESEISWIHQSDVSALFSAYPKLRELRVRGGSNLSFGSLEHSNLRRLIVESGGLDGSVVQQVAKAKLPRLEHLELWLGAPNHGATWTIGDLKPLLEGKGFPSLTHLGLRDSGGTDALAKALAKAPILDQLEALDLSMGTLGDSGGEALLTCPAIPKLKTLDLRHHYLSDAVVERFAKLKKVKVNLSEQQAEHHWGEDPQGYRYVSVGE